ncbi:MAG: ABC transporter substrate-binding protein [Actinomycetaceae bacterium]|nr:ABC transporter substrate-binding protein [Actinomycetaceae bacterium]MDY6083527.1 ABC transporter substrate-binding protein [Actinomycetaceae bacterium]
MRVSKALFASAVAAALVLAGCGGSSDSGSATSESGSGAGQVVTVNGTEPQNPFIPANINETGGGRIATVIWSGLVSYDKDGKTQMEVADSITSDDNQTWDVKLKDGWKFTNGDPVDAQSFVDAWNWGAKLSNKALSAQFFEPIEGYSTEKDTELTGLKVVSPTEFTIKLNSPQSDFVSRLGYTAFSPMPKSAFSDLKAYGEKPVGNGPYKFDNWNHNVEITLTPNPDYSGPRKVENGGLTVKFYEQMDSAYNDLLANNLDVLDTIPAASLSTFTKDLGDRAVNAPGAVFQAFAIPSYLPHFAWDEEGRLRRQALSLAIDRPTITKTIFQDTRTPATDFVAPVIPGHQEKLNGGDVLTYNPDKAKELWAKANAISDWGNTKFELAYNADGDHKAWVDATMNSIKNVLGIEAQGKPYPQFGQLRNEATQGTLTSAVRAGWQADYPSVYNFMGPIFTKNAGSNDAHYDNPDFDKLLQDALAADKDKADGMFVQAQETLIKDLPQIPLWYSNAIGGYSENVKNVQFGWDTVPLYYAVQK